MPRHSLRPVPAVAAAAALAVCLLAGCGGSGPRSPRAMLDRVPADARFVVVTDVAALREDDLIRELGLADSLAGPYEEMLGEARKSFGIDPERIGRMVVSGSWDDEDRWILGEMWGRFDLEAISDALREHGLIEGVRDGRPAFADEGEGETPNVLIVLESSRHVRFGTSAGLDRVPGDEGKTLAEVLDGDPLLGIGGSSPDVFALSLDPTLDPGFLGKDSAVGGMLHQLVGSFEGMSGALSLDGGLILSGRSIARREADAATMASLMRGGLDFAREHLRSTGEDDLAVMVDAIRVTNEGAVLTVEAHLDTATLAWLRDVVGGAAFDGSGAGRSDGS